MQCFSGIEFNQKGFSLVEVIIASGLLSFGLLSVSIAIEYMNRYDRQLEYFDSRDQLLNLLKRYGSTEGSLNSSAQVAGNEILKECMNGVYCSSTDATPFSLYMTNVPSADGRISGTPTNPARYTARGAPCKDTAPKKDCPIEVFTEFRPQCKSPVATSIYPPETCNEKPDFVEIFYTIRQADLAPADRNKIALRKVEGSIIVEL